MQKIQPFFVLIKFRFLNDKSSSVYRYFRMRLDETRGGNEYKMDSRPNFGNYFILCHCF